MARPLDHGVLKMEETHACTAVLFCMYYVFFVVVNWIFGRLVWTHIMGRTATNVTVLFDQHTDPAKHFTCGGT